MNVALSVALRVFVNTYLQEFGDVLVGLIVGVWDGAILHNSWLEDRVLEPLTLLQIVGCIFYDLLYQSNTTKALFVILGGVLGAVLSDGGAFSLFRFLEVDELGDTTIRSFQLPTIKLKHDALLDSDSDSIDSVVTVVPRKGSVHGTRRPSTRQSNRTRLTGTSRTTRSSLPRLRIPTYRRPNLPILTTTTSEAVPAALNRSYLPASGSFIPRSYPPSPVSPVRSLRDKLTKRDVRGGSTRTPSADATGRRTFSVKESPVPSIKVVPPEESTPGYSTWDDSQAPNTPSRSQSVHISSSKLPNDNPLPTIDETVVLSEWEKPMSEADIQVIAGSSSAPPTPKAQSVVINVDVPLELNLEAVLGDATLDVADYVSEATVQDSIVVGGLKNDLLTKAESYRQEAMQAMAKKTQLEAERAEARKQKRWADAFALKFQIEEQEELARKLNAKALRRYNAGKSMSCTP